MFFTDDSLCSKSVANAGGSKNIERNVARIRGSILTGDKESDLDRKYGLDKDGMMFGSKRFDVDKADNIIIDGVRYVDTPGLYELIFKRVPDDVICTEDDKQKYKNMLLTTNAHRYNHDLHDRIRGNRGNIQIQTCNRAVDINRT